MLNVSMHKYHVAASDVIEPPPVKAKPEIDMDVLFSIHPELLEDSYVYVHCHVANNWQDTLIRIWRTTYLVDHSSASRSKLVHAENITFAPQWTMIADCGKYTFLLIFSALPKSCTRFDLLEEIPQPGGFAVKDILRNTNDVYHVDIPLF